MKFKNKVYIFLGLMSIFSTHALAGNRFEGFYTGVSAGYSWGKDDEAEGSVGSAPTWFVNNKPKGVVGGLYAGYNKMLNENFLYGIEAEIENLNVDDKKNGYSPGGSALDYPISVKYKNNTSLKAKLGYVFNGQKTLAYVSAGASVARASRELYDAAGTSAVDSFTKNQSGWTAGLGVEHMFYEKFSVRAEFKHTNYGSFSVYDTNYGGAGTYDTFKSKLNTFTLGLSYHY